MASLLTIAEVAERTGLTAHTLRYYERAGLIAPVARAPGGQRRYATSDLDWIGFLLRLRETRMPIGQMQAFARLRGEGNATAGRRRELLEQHLAQVLDSIAMMQRAAKALQSKIEHYAALERNSATSLRHAPLPPKGSSHDPEDSNPLRTRPVKVARDRRRSR